MIKAAVIGATGYAGAELVRILAGHPDAEITSLTSRQYAGKRISEVYPAFSNKIDILLEEYSSEVICNCADVVFIALPHKLPMDIVPELISKGIKVVDLSADFRFDDPAAYEEHYQPHIARELLKTSVYGLCEVNSQKIKTANLVGNPGCYPTSALLPLYPVIKAGLIDPDTIIIDSKSGVSGAGRGLGLGSHFCEANESFKAYKIASHRHTPEIEETLSIAAGRYVAITFTPHLVPMARGMQTTIYADLVTDSADDEPAEKIGQCLNDFYSASPFVRMTVGNAPADSRNVRGTNCCDIGFAVDKRKNRLILTSAIDNLVKGAAGQAVQCMNLMFGIEETSGLDYPPFPV